MHTTFLTSCNIIHNGDYSGDIYIRNENSSERIGEKAEIITTTKTLILMYKKYKKETPHPDYPRNIQRISR